MKSYSHKSKRPSVRAAVVSGAVVGVFALSSCSGGGSASTEEVTSIRVADYYTDDPAKSIIGKALTDCGEEAGVTVEREMVPAAQLVPKVLQQVSSRTLPDIQMIDQSDLPVVAETGALTPLEEVGVSSDNYGDPAISAGTYDGTIYGLPPTLNAVVLYYNVDLFEEAGLTPPTTWAELEETAAALTTDDRYGVAFSATNDTQGVAQFLPMLWSGGGDETALDSPEAIGALQFWTDLVTDGSASQSVVTWGNSDAGDQFLNREAAMMFNTGSQMAKLNADETLNYGLVKVPVKEEGMESTSVLGGETWTLPRTSDIARLEKASEVLSCLLADETQLSLAVQRATIPGNPELGEEYLEELPKLSEYVETVDSAQSRTAQLGTEWASVSTALATAIQSAITGSSTPEEALKAAAGE